jgi:mycobactin lysine-N-oxygenase
VMPTLAVVGAGPKGIAIAAKARALAAVGLEAPRVVLIDRSAVAGNWGGRQGYTSGLLPLGTPPEKDVGFPYAANWGAASSAVTAAMASFSWQRHLTEPRKLLSLDLDPHSEAPEMPPAPGGLAQ